MLNSGAHERISDSGEFVPGEILLLIFNAQVDPVTFMMPSSPKHGAWACLLDTAVMEGPKPPASSSGQGRPVDGRSVVALGFVESRSQTVR